MLPAVWPELSCVIVVPLSCMRYAFWPMTLRLGTRPVVSPFYSFITGGSAPPPSFERWRRTLVGG